MNGLVSINGGVTFNTASTLYLNGFVSVNSGVSFNSGATLTIAGKRFNDLTGDGLKLNGSSLSVSLNASSGLKADAQGLGVSTNSTTSGLLATASGLSITLNPVQSGLTLNGGLKLLVNPRGVTDRKSVV